MEYRIRPLTIDDYDEIFNLWNCTEQSRRALNPIDDSREGIGRYLKRNPNTCFAAETGEKIVGVILSGHDGRRGIIHHLFVHPDFRRIIFKGKIDPTEKLLTVHRILAGKERQCHAAARLGVRISSVQQWISVYRSEGEGAFLVTSVR